MTPALALAAALAAHLLGADAPAAPADTKPPEPPPRATILEEVRGTVRSIDRQAHRLEIDTAGGPVSLQVDRNTLVFGLAGLVTVNDVAPGSPIRAGRNADFVAYWIQLRHVTGTPASTGGQGSGPAGGAGPAGAGTGEGSTPGAPPRG